jgi:hypothetical protein
MGAKLSFSGTNGPDQVILGSVSSIKYTESIDAVATNTRIKYVNTRNSDDDMTVDNQYESMMDGSLEQMGSTPLSGCADKEDPIMHLVRPKLAKMMASIDQSCSRLTFTYNPSPEYLIQNYRETYLHI